jgi:hypothetical protein
MRAHAVVLLAPFIALGCATAPETVPGPSWDIARASTVDTFRVAGQADNWGVRVTATEMLGLHPDFAIAREGNEFRGRALGLPVILGFHDGQGAGVFRAMPFSVYAQRTAVGLHVTGNFGGSLSDFELTRDRLVGRVGVCGWDLRWDGEAYTGSRGCGTLIQPVSVLLPASMVGWSDEEVGAALGLLMNVGHRPPMDRLADNSAEFRNGPVPDPALGYYYGLGRASLTATLSRSPSAGRPGMLPLGGAVPPPVSTSGMPASRAHGAPMTR